MSKVDLIKINFQSGSYINTIDTNFSELVPPTPLTLEDNLPTVNEFFDDYSALFFTIPKAGENSHTTLIEASTEYIGFAPQSLEIDALQQEITFLREQLLELRAQLNDITTTASGIANESLAQANSTEKVPNISIPAPPSPQSPPSQEQRRAVAVERLLGAPRPVNSGGRPTPTTFTKEDQSNDREQFA